MGRQGLTVKVLAAALDANLRTRQRLHAEYWPGGSWEEHDGVLLTRLPGAPHLQSAVASSGAQHPFATATEWYQGESFTLWLPGTPDAGDAEVVDDLVGMTLPTEAPPSAPVLDIRAVVDEATRVGFWSVATIFGLARTTVERLFPAALFEHGVGLVGYVGDEPVATCWSLPTDAVAGLYGVATAPTHRRQGYARAIVADAMVRASAAGCSRVALQTSQADDAFSAMGFTAVNHYRVVAPALLRS